MAAAKKIKNKIPSKKYKRYKNGVGEGFCPKCGPGTFLAKHKDRQTCGKCGYTVFLNK